MRIAHLGTFDVANYGDLLFPAVLEHRLREGMVGSLEILHCSPLGGQPVWQGAPPTLSLAELEPCGPFDAVILGGGHLVHALPTRLPAYQTDDLLRCTAYPALWLAAARIAKRDGARLIWNAPGVPRSLSRQAAKLLLAATAHVDYLAVRDEASAEHLRNSGVESRIHVVPDTALDVGRLWTSDELRREYESLFDRRERSIPECTIAVHVKERYLREPIESLAARLDSYCAARQATAILLALGPCHGDDELVRRLGMAMRTRPVVVDSPRSLREVTACLAHCDAYLGSSLHGLIAASAFGRPAWCIASERSAGPRKFSGFLRHIAASEQLVASWSEAIERLNAAEHRPIDLPGALGRLDAHWGRVRETLAADWHRSSPSAGASKDGRALLPSDGSAQELAILTAQAETALHAAGQVDRLDAELDAARRREHAARAKCEALRSTLRRSQETERRMRHQLRDARRRLARRERDLASLSGWLDHLRHGIEALLATRRWRLGNWLGDALNRITRRNAPLVTELFQDVFRRHERWRKRAAGESRRDTSTACARTVTASIVVPIHNALAAGRECLASLANHTDARHELILVDDASDAECQQLLQDFAASRPNVAVLRNEMRLGYTCTANRGWGAARGEYVVLLNSDTIVTPGWLERLLACGESDSSIGLVGPLSNAASWQSVPERFDAHGDWHTNPLPHGWTADEAAATVASQAAPNYPRVPLLNGFCLAIKRGVREAIGHFDEQAFPEGYGEETDYCLRAAAAGFTLAIADDAYVYHAKSQSYGHARRQELTEAGQQALRRKHGTSSLRRAVATLRGEPTLAQLRARLAEAFARPSRRTTDSTLRVLFLLPVQGGGGGAHSVVQEAAGMRRLGADARVAIESRFAEEYRRTYPAWFAEGLFFAYRDRRELRQFAGDFNVAVATVYFSVRLLRGIIRAHPQVLPAYYVQDYEPRFFPRFSRHAREARRSYGALPGMVHFAKTEWIRREVEQRHGVPVQAVVPSLDHGVFFPPADRNGDGRMRIAAMIRPATPYRGAERTLRMLRSLRRRIPEVELHWFGTTEAETERLRDPRLSNEHWHGRLSREEVAELLRRCDIFVDFSDYQAFGRTGLEAMACGAAVVLPRDGGAGEYAVHGENALLVDTRDDADCLRAIERLVTDAPLRAKFAAEGVRTAARYSIEAAAQSELDLFAQHLGAARVEGTPSRPAGRIRGRRSTFDPSHPRLATRRVHAILPTSGFGWPGSSYVRVLLPLQHPSLADQLALTFGDAGRAIPADAETVLVQRTAVADVAGARALVAECRQSGRRLVVELDDDFWALPSDHPERNRYRRRLAALECLLEHADLTTAPTAALAQALAGRTARVDVIPNALDERLWFDARKERLPDATDDRCVRFLMMGTRTHAADLEIVAPAARRLRGEFGDRVRFEVIGCVPRGSKSDWYEVLRIPRGAHEYRRFVRWLCRRGSWHVGLAPLRDAPFNAAKSAIKFLDYSALGLASAVSDAPAYRDVVRQLETGLLIGQDADSWYDALRTLVVNGDFRRQLAAAATADVRARHTLRQVSTHWAAALRGDGMTCAGAAAQVERIGAD